MQNVNWQIDNPRKRKIAYQTVCGVELGAPPTKPLPVFWKIVNFQNNFAFPFRRKVC